MTDLVHPQTRRRLAALFSIPFAFSLVFFFVSLATEQADTGLKQTQDLLSRVLQLRAIANDVESGERGYLLTGDETSLQPLNTALRTMANESEDARRYPPTQPQDIQNMVER